MTFHTTGPAVHAELLHDASRHTSEFTNGLAIWVPELDDGGSNAASMTYAAHKTIAQRLDAIKAAAKDEGFEIEWITRQGSRLFVTFKHLAQADIFTSQVSQEDFTNRFHGHLNKALVAIATGKTSEAVSHDKSHKVSKPADPQADAPLRESFVELASQFIRARMCFESPDGQKIELPQEHLLPRHTTKPPTKFETEVEVLETEPQDDTLLCTKQTFMNGNGQLKRRDRVKGVFHHYSSDTKKYRGLRPIQGRQYLVVRDGIETKLVLLPGLFEQQADSEDPLSEPEA